MNKEDIVKAIELFKEYPSIFSDIRACEETAIEALQAQLNDGWISVGDKLPKEAGEYLVAYHPCDWDRIYEDTNIGLDTFRGKTAWAKKKYQRVTHWQPMPTPPNSK